MSTIWSPNGSHDDAENYFVDDFGGTELGHGVGDTLVIVLNTVGLDIAAHKTCMPSTSMMWRGILVDSIEMTLSVPPKNLEELKVVVDQWGTRMIAKRQVQSILV